MTNFKICIYRLGNLLTRIFVGGSNVACGISYNVPTRGLVGHATQVKLV